MHSSDISSTFHLKISLTGVLRPTYEILVDMEEQLELGVSLPTETQNQSRKVLAITAKIQSIRSDPRDDRSLSITEFVSLVVE